MYPCTKQCALLAPALQRGDNDVETSIQHEENT